MAVYVLLAFDKDDDAKEFVKDVLQSDVVDANYNPVSAKVRGVWKKPTIFCNRTDGHLDGSKKTQSGFTRGRKYGWWVCAKCGKPSQAWSQGNSWYTALGTNLLPQSETAPEYRPYGWESPAQWNDLEDLLNPNGTVQFKNDHREKTAELIRKRLDFG